MDDRVTIVECIKCSRSGHLEHRDDRWWCAWCQAWTGVSTLSVKNCVFDRTKSIPILANSPQSIRRQALRIPPGWDIVINSLSDEDPPTEQVEIDPHWNGSDIFYAVNTHRSIAIDIDTRTDSPSSMPRYRFRLVRSSGDEVDWNDPVLFKETSSRIELVQLIESMMDQ